MNASNRDRLHSTTLQNSRRSLHSESESDVGSLLSGLSQARNIPDRRKLPNKEKNGRGGLPRTIPKPSSNGVANKRPTRDGSSKQKQKNEAFKREVSKIVKLQAFARAYIVRFAYNSRLTMEKTKRRFFAIQLQANIRGFLQRQRYRNMTGKGRVQRTIPEKKPNTARTGLGSPQQERRTRTRDLRRTAPRPTVSGIPMESESERSEISIRMDRLISNPPAGRRSSIGESESEAGSVASNLSRLSQARRVPDRRRKQEIKAGEKVIMIANPPTGRGRPIQTEDHLGESESEVGSVASNLSRLSQARRVPDRRRKQEAKEAKSVMISNPPIPRGPSRQRANHLDESESELGSVASNLSRLSQARRVPNRRRKQEAGEAKLVMIANPPIGRGPTRQAAEHMDESESEVGSVMSNLSRLSHARKVPDRRRKREATEAKVVKIQALSRGYIQRFLYRSMLAMENTKKKYAAITIQAYVRGFLQRKNGPEVSRVYVAPKREPLPAKRKKTTSNSPSGSTDSREKRRKSRYTKKSSQLHGRSNKNNKIDETSTPHKTMKKPVRHRSDSEGGDNMFPRQLTIRKPRRQTSDTEEESYDVPVKQLTIRKPRRQHNQSFDSENSLPKRVALGAMTSSRTRGRNVNNVELSPPRKVMLRVKKGKRPEIDLDKSEESLEPDKALMGRKDRNAHPNNNTSESRLGESESDVGSLMSGLSQARKVPDRRLKRQLPGLRNPKRGEKVNSEKQLAKVKGATKIQAVARGYIVRFAYKSRLTMERTKRRFFAIQIQALARGYIVRTRR